MPRLDDITIGNYQIAAGKIARQYVPYYQNLSFTYSDVKSGIGKFIQDQVKNLQDILPLLARVSGRGGTVITRKELKKLDALLEEISSNHSQIVIWVKESESFKETSENAINKLGVAPEDLQSAKTSVEGKRKQQGSISELSGIAGSITRALGLGSPGKVIGLAAILPFLAPFAGPSFAKAGLALYETSRGLGINKLLKLPFKALKKRFGKHKSFLDSSSGLKTPSRIFSREPEFRDQEILGKTSFSKSQAFRTLSRRKKEERTDSLFYFFDKRAYKAHWTRDVLAALKDKKIQKGSGIGKSLWAAATGATAGAVTGTAIKGTFLGVLGAKIMGGLKLLTSSYLVYLLSTIKRHALGITPKDDLFDKMETKFREFAGGIDHGAEAWKSYNKSKIGPVPEQSTFLRYLGLGPSKGKRTLLKDAATFSTSFFTPKVEPLPKYWPGSGYDKKGGPYDPSEGPHIPSKELFSEETNKILKEINQNLQNIPNLSANTGQGPSLQPALPGHDDDPLLRGFPENMRYLDEN